MVEIRYRRISMTSGLADGVGENFLSLLKETNQCRE